ncbi:hypothetical protein QF044_001085 [Chryseobacterium sp. W4I1]|nr:hypothetical protein [Chryseobacterium sp. W4I1]
MNVYSEGGLKPAPISYSSRMRNIYMFFKIAVKFLINKNVVLFFLKILKCSQYMSNGNILHLTSHVSYLVSCILYLVSCILRKPSPTNFVHTPLSAG